MLFKLTPCHNALLQAMALVVVLSDAAVHVAVFRLCAGTQAVIASALPFTVRVTG